jgi:crossover junction endodeoxyribonuclease RuvC
MRIIAIDPGYDRLGIAVLEGESSSPVVIFSSCITTNKNLAFPLRLAILGQDFAKFLSMHTPDALALETLFFNKNVKTAIEVAEARGVLLYLAAAKGLPIHEYSPQAIKLAVTGYGKSDKASVTAMVKRLATGVPESALDDEYDAIAIGITCLAHTASHR